VLFSTVFGRKKGGIGLAEKEHHLACGMHLCGKCSWSVLVFGLLFLIAGLGLWAGAPAWWNGWTILGAFFFIWGLMTKMGM